jgi:hypothetical protein
MTPPGSAAERDWCPSPSNRPGGVGGSQAGALWRPSSMHRSAVMKAARMVAVMQP